MDRVAEAAKRLTFQGVETLPWELDQDYDPPQKLMPVGIVLRHQDGRLILIGNDRAGVRDAGCECCTAVWADAIRDYTEWAWLI